MKFSTFCSDFCIKPVSTSDKIITFSCPGEDSNNCLVNGLVRQFTIATIQCTQNYFSAPETNFISICNGRNWQPPIDRCFSKYNTRKSFYSDFINNND